jgi:hypothetical protein
MNASLAPTGPKPARSAWKIDAFPEASRRSRILLALLAAWAFSLPALIGLVEWRRLTFSRISAGHQARILGIYKNNGYLGPIHPQPIAPGGRILSPVERRKDQWHVRLHEKYRDAAGRPWLPVWPDSPEPQ